MNKEYNASFDEALKITRKESNDIEEYLKVVELDVTDKITKQRVKKNATVFDFDKIFNSEFGIVIVISERGAKGKTYNVKDSALREFIKNPNKEPYLWIRNTQAQLDVELGKFLDEPEPYKAMEMTGSSAKNNVWINYLDEYETTDKEGNLVKKFDMLPFIRFMSFNSAEKEKGTRVIYKRIIYDEFNVDTNKVSEIEQKFSSLIGSTENQVTFIDGNIDDSQLIMFGNYKSLNHPLLHGLGLTYVNAPVTKIYAGKLPYMLVLLPQDSESLIEAKKHAQRNNWRSIARLQLGTFESDMLNESLYDETNFVMNLREFMYQYKVPANDVKLISSIVVEGYKLNLYDIESTKSFNPLGTQLHILVANNPNQKIDSPVFPSKNLWAPKRKYVEEGVQLMDTNLVSKFRIMVSNNLISFENVVSRDLFIRFVIS